MDIIEKSNIPRGYKILCMVWSFRQKTNPFNIVYRWRSRLCVDGSQQEEGIDYDTSYSPVVAWSTVRFCLTLSAINGWKSRQIDYVQAFPQAALHEDEHIYVEIPRDFYVHNTDDTRHYALKLNKNVYGLKQASHNWWEKLSSG